MVKATYTTLEGKTYDITRIDEDTTPGFLRLQTVDGYLLVVSVDAIAQKRLCLLDSGNHDCSLQPTGIRFLLFNKNGVKRRFFLHAILGEIGLDGLPNVDFKWVEE